MSSSTTIAPVRTALRVWAGIRIGYGVTAILAPPVLLRVLRIEPQDDVRGFNAFLGSRDVVIGAISLRARTPEEVAAAVTLNFGNEVVDSVVLAQEVRAGRRADPFTVVGVLFNALGWATWLTARRRLR